MISTKNAYQKKEEFDLTLYTLSIFDLDAVADADQFLTGAELNDVARNKGFFLALQTHGNGIAALLPHHLAELVDGVGRWMPVGWELLGHRCS